MRRGLLRKGENTMNTKYAYLYNDYDKEYMEYIKQKEKNSKDIEEERNNGIDVKVNVPSIKSIEKVFEKNGFKVVKSAVK